MSTSATDYSTRSGESYAIEPKANLAPSCHICNQDKARFRPTAPGMTLLLDTAEKRQSHVERWAASFAARRVLITRSPSCLRRQQQAL